MGLANGRFLQAVHDLDYSSVQEMTCGMFGVNPKKCNDDNGDGPLHVLAASLHRERTFGVGRGFHEGRAKFLGNVVRDSFRLGEDTKNIVGFLKRHGVDVNRANKFGETPMLAAIRYQNLYVVEALLHIGKVSVTHKDVLHAADHGKGTRVGDFVRFKLRIWHDRVPSTDSLKDEEQTARALAIAEMTGRASSVKADHTEALDGWRRYETGRHSAPSPAVSEPVDVIDAHNDHQHRVAEASIALALRDKEQQSQRVEAEAKRAAEFRASTERKQREHEEWRRRQSGRGV